MADLFIFGRAGTRLWLVPTRGCRGGWETVCVWGVFGLHGYISAKTCFHMTAVELRRPPFCL